MVKAGLVYATATEDMDCLTFGSSVMLRHLTASEAKYGKCVVPFVYLFTVLFVVFYSLYSCKPFMNCAQLSTLRVVC